MANRLGMVHGLTTHDKYDIALFINEKEKARWSDLQKEFVDKDSERHISRQTLSKFLKDLREDGIVTKTVDAKFLALTHIIRPIYKVTKNGKKRLQKIADRKEIYTFLETATPAEIAKLQEEIAQLKKN